MPAAVEELRAQGVPVVQEPIEMQPCTIAIVADPDGNRVLLHRRKDGTAG